MHWKQAICCYFFQPGCDTLQDKDVGWRDRGLARLDRNPPEYQDMSLVPGLGSLWSQTPEYFLCSIRNDPCMLEGSGCAVLAGFFVPQNRGHDWNKIQQQ